MKGESYVSDICIRVYWFRRFVFCWIICICCDRYNGERGMKVLLLSKVMLCLYFFSVIFGFLHVLVVGFGPEVFGVVYILIVI